MLLRTSAFYAPHTTRATAAVIMDPELLFY
jgi:hypothetical protein